MTTITSIPLFQTVVGTMLVLGLSACGDPKSAPRATQPSQPKSETNPETAIDSDAPLRVVAKVEQLSKIPDPSTMEYDDLITTVKLAVETVEKGQYDKKDILVQILAIQDRKRLPAASLAVGNRVRLHLRPWKDTAEEIKSLQQVDDINDYELPPFFAVAHTIVP